MFLLKMFILFWPTLLSARPTKKKKKKLTKKLLGSSAKKKTYNQRTEGRDMLPDNIEDLFQRKFLVQHKVSRVQGMQQNENYSKQEAMTTIR